MGIELGPDDWAVRCNLMTIRDGRLTRLHGRPHHQRGGPGADRGPPGRARRPGDRVPPRRQLPQPDDLSRSAGRAPPFTEDTVTDPPHDIPTSPPPTTCPGGPGADAPRDLMQAGSAVLADHPVNQARLAAGKPPANAIWLWGQGKAPSRAQVRRPPRADGGDHLGGRPGPRRRRARRAGPDRRPGRDRLPRHRLRRQGRGTASRRCATTTSSASTSRPPTRPATRAGPTPRSRPSSGSTATSSARSARRWRRTATGGS